MLSRLRTRRATWLAGSVAAAGFALIVGVGTILAGPTRGPIPPEAFPRDGGAIDRSVVPDFVPALGPDGAVVGWVSKELAVPEADSAARDAIPVYADDLETIVGHMVRGRGFVPAGVDLGSLIDAIPTPPLPDLTD